IRSRCRLSRTLTSGYGLVNLMHSTYTASALIVVPSFHPVHTSFMSSSSTSVPSGLLSRLPSHPWWMGIALAAAIALAGLWLSELPIMQGLGFSSLTFAIVIGMVLGNTI